MQTPSARLVLPAGLILALGVGSLSATRSYAARTPHAADRTAANRARKQGTSSSCHHGSMSMMYMFLCYLIVAVQLEDPQQKRVATDLPVHVGASCCQGCQSDTMTVLASLPV